MKTAICFAMVFIRCALPIHAQTQYFLQNFSTSSTIADYVNASAPDAGQFNAISSNGSGVTNTIINSALQISRTGSNIGACTRNTNFSPLPSGLLIQFALAVSGNSTATQAAATVQIGSSFSVTNGLESNSNCFAKLGIDFLETEGSFAIRNITGSSSSQTFTGTQYVIWALNNSATTFTYLAADGSTESIAADRADIWVGSVKVFDDITVQSASVALSDFKIVFSSGTGTIILDDFSISGSNSGFSLPVELSSFSYISRHGSPALAWITVTEVNTNGFEVESSPDQVKWKTLGFVPAAGNSNIQRSYTFALHGTGNNDAYYRLRIIDNDGTSTHSKVITSIAIERKQIYLAQNYPNPFNPETRIEYSIPESGFVELMVVNAYGEQVAKLVNDYRTAGNYSTSFNSRGLASGVYYYQLRFGNYTKVKNLVVLH